MRLLGFGYTKALKDSQKGYNNAVIHYKNQKNLFLRMLQETNQKALLENEKKLLENLSSEVEAEFQKNESDFGKKTEELYNQIEIYAKKYIESDDATKLKSSLNALRDNEAQREKMAMQEASKLAERVRTRIENVLTDSQLSTLRSELKNIYTSVYEVGANEAASQGSYGMFRRALFEELTGTPYQMSSQSQGGYTKLLSGYYAEAAIANVFGKWAEGTSMKILEAGVKEGKTDIAIGLGNLEKQLEEIEKFSANITSDADIAASLSNNTTFGVQSKSWGIPDLEKIVHGKNVYSKGYMSVGHHQALWASLSVNQQEFAETRGWYQNVKELSTRLLTAIGPANVIYRLRDNQMMWTHELIEGMMQKKYYLAFWFKRAAKGKGYIYPATTELAWQRIDDRRKYRKKK